MPTRRSILGAMMAGMTFPGFVAGSEQRFFAPAEEARHTRTWLCWPSTRAIYRRGKGYYEDVQETIARLAAAIAEHEPVTMLADASLHAQAAKLCGPKVQFLDAKTDDMWARDTGPVFVVDGAGGKALVDFNFNGWGGKERHKLDDLVPNAIAAHLDLPLIDSQLVGEGGGIEFDGEGTLLLTDSCWVNDNRNPGKSRDEIEAALKACLGVETVIWLPGVRGQEITDGHIDGSVRIIRPGVLMMSGIPGDTSEWGAAYEESKQILQRTKDAKGRSFEIVEVPWAEQWRSKDPDFFAGYANFYVGNGAVYTPQFGDKRGDAKAVEAFQALYPDREVVALNVDRIYENGGGIHCVTQQEPAA